jgi:hypothetical protein
LSESAWQYDKENNNIAILGSSNKSLRSALPLVRVLEIPTPTRIAFDEKIFETKAPDRVRR